MCINLKDVYGFQNYVDIPQIARPTLGKKGSHICLERVIFVYKCLFEYVVLFGDILAHSSSNIFRTHKHKYRVTIKSASKYSSSLQFLEKKMNFIFLESYSHTRKRFIISNQKNFEKFFSFRLLQENQIYISIKNQSTVMKNTVNSISCQVDIFFNPKVKQTNSCLFNHFSMLVSLY